jgi:hypothetical protein
MTNYPTYNENDLEVYFSNQEFVRKTALQIKKNLNQFGYEFDPKLNSAEILNEMIQLLNPVVEDFIQNNAEKFMAYLYQVDLNEKLLNKNEFGKDYISNVSFKIIKREAQKIFFQFVMSDRKI